MLLPNLPINETLNPSQIEGFVAFDDLENVQQWRMSINQFRYAPMPADAFQGQIDTMRDSWAQFPKDKNRTDRIVELLNRGQPVYPVFVEEGDFSYFVIEGRHRLAAFHILGMKTIPVLFVKRAQ